MNKPFTIKLSEEHRAKLEAHRAAFGLRSEADAVRHLIDAEDAAVRAIDVKILKPTPETMEWAKRVVENDYVGEVQRREMLGGVMFAIALRAPD